MPVKEHLPLEPADIKKLRQQLFAMLAFPVVVIGMFLLFISFVFKDFKNSFVGDTVVMYVFIGFCLFFFGVIAYMIGTTAIDLRRGIKHRISGRVTDKRLNIQTTGGGSGAGGKTRTTRQYYLYLDDKEFSVDYREYTQVKVGMDVVMDRAPKSKRTLKLDILSRSDATNDPLPRTDTDRFLEKRIPHTRYAQKDFEALKRIWYAALKRRLFLAAPFVSIGILLLISGFWGFAVFLFPLWAVPLYQAFQLYRVHRNYRRNKFSAHKKGVAALVEDKLTITSNRRSNSNSIRTTQGTIKVNTVLYDKLSVGDGITIFMTQYGNMPISLLTMDQEEFYLV
ncbi:hypothetical protein [Flagellimonas amoyensis]|uniref:hypothetical protein n=1 Tax=Flagellimonas amoyensis TaxID=2169401 RepID=UPI000D352852|nr:hypothetical protein [Allomuricauda amoyensis]